MVITERGRPVARLVPVSRKRPFPDLAAVRRKAHPMLAGLSQAVLEDRDDRL